MNTSAEALSALERLQKSAEKHDFRLGPLELPLRRYHPTREGRKGAVLLLHGASTCSDIFLVPSGGLVNYLQNEGWEVWTLDWRGSSRIVSPLVSSWEAKAPLGGSVVAERKLFTLDAVAAEDIPGALRRIREQIGVDTPLAAIGFCVGSGALAIAAARGYLEEFRLENLVLITLGLFYETPWDGWIKSEDFIIERVLAHDPGCRGISPQVPGEWPVDMRDSHARWPCAWLARGERAEVFRRLTFMFGEPYSVAQITPAIPPEMVDDIFGHMHLGIYLHLGQQVRRGFSAVFDAPDVIDRSRVLSGPVLGGTVNDLTPECFRDKRVTLIGGAQNRLWHRDSVDLMYEWLRAHAPRRSPQLPHQKHVLGRYAHLDLLWNERSVNDVYTHISDGIA